jgi:hypothetical protein
MRDRYAPRMTIDTGAMTEAAALAARERLTEQTRAGALSERGMAGIAKTAIFEEALLAAIKARLGELKAVAK